MGSVFRKIVAAAAATASLAAHAIATSWTVVNLGTIGGPGLSSPQAISDNGIVVGCAAVPGDSGTRAFVYANGTMTDLAPDAPRDSLNCATAVNSNGMIAGRLGGEIVVWRNGSLTRLGVAGGINAINEAGIAVGTITEASSTQPAPTHGFMWANGNLIMLPMDSASDINERNEILGSAANTPVLYSNGTITQLPVPVGHLNDGDVMVGGMNFMPSGGEPSPFYYDGSAHMIPGAPCCGFALRVNNAMQIVGSSEGTHGWFFDGGQTSTLDRLGGVAASGWGHLEPTAMNERGWIVGTGNNSTSFGFGGFLLMPAASSTPATDANPAARDLSRNHSLVRARYP